MNNGVKEDQKISPLIKEEVCFAVHLINRYNLHKKLPLSNICIILAENNMTDQVHILIGLKSDLYLQNINSAK